MITEKQCRKIVDIAVAHGKGRTDGVEVHVSSSNVATSRFANNGMTQNQAPQRTEVSVRVILDGKQARLSSDDTSSKGIKTLVDNAIIATTLLEKDPELLPLYAPSSKDNVSAATRYDAKTAKMGPLDRAACVNAIVDEGKQRHLNASGVYVSGTNVFAVGNSAGLFRYHRETEAECSVTMTATDSSGWSKGHSPLASTVDARTLGRIAADKAAASANPIEVEPGRYTVILEPSAVLDLLGFLGYDFAGTSHKDKLSCFLNKVGMKVLGDNICIYDDAEHPLQAGAAFDGEGMPRKRVTLVENGVIKGLVYGRRSAKALGAEPTGHGMVEPSSMGEFPMNIVVAGGTSSLEQMIAESERAILLTRVWYVREVDPAQKIVTGMTRDGTFLVENGKIKAGIRNLRFNQGLIEMLNNVVALGPSVRTAGEEAFPAVVPAMKVRNFNFSSVTKF